MIIKVLKSPPLLAPPYKLEHWWLLQRSTRGVRRGPPRANASGCACARASISLCSVHAAAYPQRLVAGTRGKGGPLAEEGGVRARVCLAAGARLTSLVPCTCAFVTHRGWPLGPAERGARLQRTMGGESGRVARGSAGGASVPGAIICSSTPVARHPVRVRRGLSLPLTATHRNSSRALLHAAGVLYYAGSLLWR
jgi:hypothetical protein